MSFHSFLLSLSLSLCFLPSSLSFFRRRQQNIAAVLQQILLYSDGQAKTNVPEIEAASRLHRGMGYHLLLTQIPLLKHEVISFSFSSAGIKFAVGNNDLT
jgi:hypothetical protein